MKHGLVVFLLAAHTLLWAADHPPPSSYKKWKQTFKTMQLMGAEQKRYSDKSYAEIFTLPLQPGNKNEFHLYASSKRDSILLQFRSSKPQRNRLKKNQPQQITGIVYLHTSQIKGQHEVFVPQFHFSFTDPHEKIFIQIPTSKSMVKDRRAYYMDQFGILAPFLWKNLREREHTVTLFIKTKTTFFSRNICVNTAVFLKEPTAVLPTPAPRMCFLPACESLEGEVDA